MRSFEWSLPTRVVFGLGRFNDVHKYVRGFGKKAFIVTSPSFMGARKPLLDALLAQLKTIDVETMVFSGIQPNPRSITIDEAACVVREFRPRYIVALGGGSVMDSSKVIALLGLNEGQALEYAHTKNEQKRRKFNSALPLVCIPTLAATSSETDSLGVITDWESKRKVVVWGASLLPVVSIIDPELTFSVGAKQTVEGAFDIITHVMEEYLSTDDAGFMQDRLSEAIVETVVRALPAALAVPHDQTARSNLSWAASFALCGALQGRDGSFPVHALEHGLSAYTDVAHGRGLAMILPRKMAFDSKVIGEKIVHFNKKIFGVAGTSDPIISLEQGLVRFMKEVGAWTCLKDIPLHPEGFIKNYDELIVKTVEHAFELDAVLKRGEEAYLDNVCPILMDNALEILNSCRLDCL